MRRKAMFLVFAGSVLVAPTFAQANVVLTYSDLLPDVVYNISGSQFLVGSFNETETLEKGDAGKLPLADSVGTVSANAGLTYTNADSMIRYPDPGLSVDMTTTVVDHYQEFHANASVTFFFQVYQTNLYADQPTSIAVDITGSFFGGDANEFSDAEVNVYDPNQVNVGSEDLYSAQAGAPSSDKYPFLLTINAVPFVIYEVKYSASAGACTVPNGNSELCGFTTPGGPYIAGIDPVLDIDPALAANGDYFLSVSAGFAPAAPEPATWVLLALGFAGLGALSLRTATRGEQV